MGEIRNDKLLPHSKSMWLNLNMSNSQKKKKKEEEYNGMSVFYTLILYNFCRKVSTTGPHSQTGLKKAQSQIEPIITYKLINWSENHKQESMLSDV